MHPSRRTVIALAVAILSLTALSLSACTTGPATRGSSGTSSPARAVAPTIKLVTPTDGAEVPAGDLPMTVETTGLKFVMPSNTVVPGEGHVHFTLDDKPLQMSATPAYVMKNVTPGPHTLKAVLVQNDAKPLDPPVVQTVTFTVK